MRSLAVLVLAPLAGCSLVFSDPVDPLELGQLSPAIEACSDYYLTLQSALECSDNGSVVAPCADIPERENCDFTGYFECLEERVSCELGQLQLDSPTNCALPCVEAGDPFAACEAYEQIDDELNCNQWTPDECSQLRSVGCELDEFFECLEFFATCSSEVHLRCARATNCEEGLTTFYACEDFQRRTRALSCGQDTFFGSCSFSIRSCENSEFYECLSERTFCQNGFPNVDPGGFCQSQLDCQFGGGNDDAVEACFDYRASVLNCRPDLPFEQFICENVRFTQCDLAPLFRCMADNVICTDQGPRTLYEGCATLTTCPASSRTIGACMRAADTIESSCEDDVFFNTPRFDCAFLNGCDRSPFYACLEENQRCNEGIPNQCFAIDGCP